MKKMDREKSKRFQHSKGVRREQPRKDNKSKRVNFDNERVSKFEKDISSEMTAAANDIRWYARNPELLNSSGSVIFSSTTGQQIPFDQYSIPGVYALQWVPELGPANVKAITQAQESIYSYVVHANSRNQSYDPVDLMVMILGVANVFSWISAGIRAYGTIKCFDGQNIYTPKALVTAQGFDYSDLVANQSTMWYYLNQLIAMSSQLWIPNDLPFVERWFWLNANIYKDADSVKSQYYMYVPSNPWKYNPTISAQGAGLEVVDTVPGTTTKFGKDTHHLLTFAEYSKIMDTIINSFINVQDRGIMLGDVLKAYGADKIYALNEIPSDYRVNIMHDKEVLTQIENSTCAFRDMLNVVPNADGTYARPLPKLAANANTWPGICDTFNHMYPDNVMLNFHFPNQPTASDIMIATRLTAVGNQSSTYPSEGKYTTDPANFGTELITRYTIYWYSSATKLSSIDFSSMMISFPDTADKSSVPLINKNAKIMALSSMFDWAPILYLLQYDQTVVERDWLEVIGDKIYPRTSAHAKTGYIVGDIDNAIPINYTITSKLHNTAIYSEFGVPKL